MENLLQYPIVDPMRVKLRLRQYRRANGLTQAGLAKALCVSQPIVSRIETGERGLKPVELLRTCETLGLSIEEFLDVKLPPKQLSLFSFDEYNGIRGFVAYVKKGADKALFNIWSGWLNADITLAYDQTAEKLTLQRWDEQEWDYSKIRLLIYEFFKPQRFVAVQAHGHGKPLEFVSQEKFERCNYMKENKKWKG